MQQSQRRRRPRTPNETKAPAAASLLALALLGPSAALGDGAAALLATTAEGQALVMPRDAPEGASAIAIAGVQVEVAVEGAFRVYRVRHRGRIHTAHAPVQGRPQQFAFDFERQRLAEVAPSLLVYLGAETDLNRIIKAAGALGGKAYPALGWALLRLPPEANPAAVAQELETRGLVASAEVQLRNAVYVPL